MFTIHGLNISSNTTKTIYVAEALKTNYEFIPVDLSKGEHKSPEHLQRHPLGKVPTLTHNNHCLFESNAICCYMASVEKSDLYPLDDNWQKAEIDKWLAFFTNHLGRWLNTYAFEKVAKEKYGFGTPNKELEEEAFKFILQQLPPIEAQLDKNRYFVNNKITIADYVAFAYFENAELAELSLNDYPAIQQWYLALKKSEEIKAGRANMGLVEL